MVQLLINDLDDTWTVRWRVNPSTIEQNPTPEVYIFRIFFEFPDNTLANKVQYFSQTKI